MSYTGQTQWHPEVKLEDENFTEFDLFVCMFECTSQLTLEPNTC